MATQHITHRSRGKAQPWIDWTNLTLGVFLAASPWLALGGGSAVMLNAATSGIIIAIAAGGALSTPNAGAQWLNACIGLWLLIAPMLLGFSADSDAMWTSVLVGISVAILAFTQLSVMSRTRRV